MTRFSTVFVVFASPAWADPGHLAGVAGHDHWIALGAIGLAAALGAWAALKGKKEAQGEPVSEDAEA